jgi:hypothetical protein
MAKTEYQRLARARARSSFAVAFMSRTSLWLGSDHLLFVDSSGYTETYKRFYFRDIQAITTQQTDRGRVWSIVLGIAFIFSLFFILFTQPKGSPSGWSGGEMAGEILLGSLMGVIVLFLLINFFLSPTCKTFLRTAVQIEELPSLCRVRQTRKVLEKIRPLIATAQGGELSPETISELMRQSAQSSAAGSTTTGANDPGIPPRLDS